MCAKRVARLSRPLLAVLCSISSVLSEACSVKSDPPAAALPLSWGTSSEMPSDANDGDTTSLKEPPPSTVGLADCFWSSARFSAASLSACASLLSQMSGSRFEGKSALQRVHRGGPVKPRAGSSCQLAPMPHTVRARKGHRSMWPAFDDRGGVDDPQKGVFHQRLDLDSIFIRPLSSRCGQRAVRHVHEFNLFNLHSCSRCAPWRETAVTAETQPAHGSHGSHGSHGGAVDRGKCAPAPPDTAARSESARSPLSGRGRMGLCSSKSKGSVARVRSS